MGEPGRYTASNWNKSLRLWTEDKSKHTYVKNNVETRGSLGKALKFNANLYTAHAIS